MDMSKLTREYKSELLKLAIRAHRGTSTTVTLCGRHIELHTLVRHIHKVSAGMKGKKK